MCAVVIVIFGVCTSVRKSVRISYIFAVTFCKCPINLITNPNPVYSHSKIGQYVPMYVCMYVARVRLWKEGLVCAAVTVRLYNIRCQDTTSED
jgi:hypothetical protein